MVSSKIIGLGKTFFVRKNTYFKSMFSMKIFEIENFRPENLFHKKNVLF